MSLFKNQITSADIADEKDSIGGGFVLDSGLYQATIALAYGITSTSGATGLVIQAKTAQGQVIKQTFWTASGRDKGCKNYYEKDGKKNYLPGFLQAQALTLLACGKELHEIEAETKIVNVYNSDAKAEIPTKVEMLMELLDKEILIGLVKQTVDKNAKDSNGVYQPTGETREENEIDKLFRASDRMSVVEIRAKVDTAAFADTWLTKWGGMVKDKSTKTSGTPGAPKTGSTGTKKPSASLFA